MVFQKILLVVVMFIGLFSLWGIINTTYAGNNISSSDFEINVSTLSPWSTALGSSWGSKKVAEGILGKLIEKLIIAFWVIALLIMTIGAGYMIIYSWQDEFLSRWKYIFTSWLVSLAVALSAGMIVKLMAYILYQ